MRYYISDLHFCHSNLNQHMDMRGFASGEEMNDYMVTQWNSRVRKKDEVVILGDFCLSRNPKEVNEILDKLQGRKYLIIGNHDHYLKDKDFDRSAFDWIEDYKELNDNKRKIILSHYPIMCYNGQYRKGEDGIPKTYMLYGHVHNTFDEVIINGYVNRVRSMARSLRGTDKADNIPCQMINCFCMFSDYVPLTLEEWIEVDEKRRTKLNCEEIKEPKNE